MHIFELTPDPAHLNDENWLASKHKSRVIVRAETEEQARQLAYAEFGIAVQRAPSGKFPVNPWKYPLVKCEIQINGLYPVDGKPRILDPYVYQHGDELKLKTQIANAS